MEITPPTIGFYLDICKITNKNVSKSLICFDKCQYYVVCYDKEMLCYNDNETKLYRGVIYSYPEQKLLGYFPPKSLTYNQFKCYYPTITHNIKISEYIRGEMINLFYDSRCDKWRIVTHTDISETNIMSRFMRTFTRNNNNYSPILDYLPRDKTYTFILKKTFMKNKNEEDRFYLISVYELDNNIVKYIPYIDYENWSIMRDIEGIIHFPKKYSIESYADLNEITEEIDGFIIKDIYTGASTKIISGNTTLKETMSKINPYHTFEYLCVRRINKLYEYNQIYHKTKQIRNDIHAEYERLLTMLHQHYLNVHVFKNKILVPEKYKQYVNLLHTRVYIPSIKKGNKSKITRNCVKEYLNQLNPSELLYLMYG